MMARAVCKHCVLPEHNPDIWLNKDGVCNICAAYRKTTDPAHIPPMHETDVVNILQKHRGSARYDCLALCSGGKDSTAGLYYLRKRYKMNPLVFTFDNGFENETAIANVKRACDILQVDWEYSRSSFMNEMYAEVIRAKARFPVCMLCSLWYMQKVYEVARYYGIKLIIGGWTKGQRNIEDACMRALVSDIPGFVKAMRAKYRAYKDFPAGMAELKWKFPWSAWTTVLSLHWFLPYGAEDYVGVIKKELDWENVAGSYPAHSANCAVNSVCSNLLLKETGLTHFHVEKSDLIRQGQLSRQEALDSLAFDGDDRRLSAACDNVLDKLGFGAHR